MADRDVRKDLETSAGDAALTVARTVASLAPFGTGSVAAELLNAVFGPVLQKRRDEWIIYLADSLQEVQEKVNTFNIEDLANNEQFVTAAVDATMIAIRTHQQEKLEALRNAVTNTAAGISIDENIQMMFLASIDELTPLHLRALKYFKSPRDYAKQHNISPKSYYSGARVSALRDCIPELQGKDNVIRLIVDTLSAKGFIIGDVTSLFSMVTGNSIWDPLISELGSQFLTYISEKQS